MYVYICAEHIYVFIHTQIYWSDFTSKIDHVRNHVEKNIQHISSIIND